jgi:hypothetical protein
VDLYLDRPVQRLLRTASQSSATEWLTQIVAGEKQAFFKVGFRLASSACNLAL